MSTETPLPWVELKPMTIEQFDKVGEALGESKRWVKYDEMVGPVLMVPRAHARAMVEALKWYADRHRYVYLDETDEESLAPEIMYCFPGIYLESDLHKDGKGPWWKADEVLRMIGVK